MKFVKIIQSYSILFNRVLTQVPAHVPAERAEAGRGRSRAARQAVRARGASASFFSYTLTFRLVLYFDTSILSKSVFIQGLSRRR